MPTLFLDLETYCETPITYGTHRYAETVEITVAAWAEDDGPVRVEDWTLPMMTSTLPARMLNADRVVIHNSHFDRTVLRHNNIVLPPEKIVDTMALALAHSLPGSLGKLCDVLNIPQDQAKDKDGNRLIQLFCKPRPQKQKLRRATRETHPEDWAKFLDYARLDIEAMRAVYKRIPKWNWTAAERELWLLDQKINDRGVQIDMDLVRAAIAAVDIAQAGLSQDAQDLTGGVIGAATQRDALMTYIATVFDLDLNDLRGATVEKLLEDDRLHPDLRDLLAVRLKASTTSTAKYKALRNSISSDGRLRGTLQFCGASRTGRFCLAEGSPVLVKDHTGSVYETPIETVFKTDLVFDGVEWVSHEGVVFSGTKAVTDHDGVIATREHVVYVNTDQSMPLQAAKEAGLRIWGLSDVLSLPPDVSEWWKLHRADRELREGALADALCASVKPKESEPSFVQCDPKVRERVVQRGDAGNGVDEVGGTAARDGTHRRARPGLQHFAGRGDGCFGRREGFLGAPEERPESQGRIYEEPERRYSRHLSSAGQFQPVEQRRQVEGGEPSRGVSAILSSIADCGTGRWLKTPGSSFYEVGPSADTVKEGRAGPQGFRECRAREAGVGHEGPDPTSCEHFTSLEAALAGSGRSTRQTGETRSSESRTEAENRSIQSGDVREDQGGLGEKTCRTYDIINAGPRNRFTVSGKVVSNSGRLFQPQNLPRPNLKNAMIEGGIELLKCGAAELATDNVMELTSNAIRGCIVAPPGKKLVVADLSNIEGRVLAWLAGEKWKLQAFRDFDAGIGHDLYVLAVSRTFGLDPKAVTKQQRQWGKVLELALGFEGGVGAFLTFATAYNIDLDDMAQRARANLSASVVEDANGAWDWMNDQKRPTFGLSRETWTGIDAVKRAWRKAHPAISVFWKQLQHAVADAVEAPNAGHWVGDHLMVERRGAWLKIILPSCRALSYPAVRVEDGKISYTGVNQFTRQWGRIGTYGGKLAENVTQATARDVLASGMLGIDSLGGYDIALSVHDELITEAPDTDDFSADELARLMSIVPDWAEGLPLAAAGFEAYRYKKED